MTRTHWCSNCHRNPALDTGAAISLAKESSLRQRDRRGASPHGRTNWVRVSCFGLTESGAGGSGDFTVPWVITCLPATRPAHAAPWEAAECDKEIRWMIDFYNNGSGL